MLNRLRHSASRGVIRAPQNIQDNSLIRYWNTRKPSNAKVVITGDTTATVTWDDAVAAADGIKVYISTDGGITKILKATVNYGVETASITELTPNTIYAFYVIAYKGANESDSISTVDVTIPTILLDGNTVTMFEPLSVNGRLLDSSSKEMVWWDQMIGSTTLLDEESSGETIAYGVYKITATESNHFFTGCQVGDIFAAVGGVVIDANNKVRRYSGNHASQPVAAKRPVDADFNGTTDSRFMKTATFDYNQPEYIYAVLKRTWEHGKEWDGNAFNSGTYDDYAGTPVNIIRVGDANLKLGSNQLLDDKWGIVRTLINGASSKIAINNNDFILGTVSAGNMDGITIGAGGTGTYPAICTYRKFIARKIADTDADSNEIYSYLYKKYSDLVDLTPIATKDMLLTATGNGTGIANLQMATNGGYVLATLDGEARFYTDSAATQNESKTWFFSGPGTTSIYIRCSSGTSNLKFNSNNPTQFAVWTSAANAPSLSGDVSQFTLLTKISVGGNNALTGDISQLPLTYLNVLGSNRLSGDLKYNSAALTYVRLTACAMDTYTAGGNWSGILAGGTIHISPSPGYGYSSAMIDLLLQEIASTKFPGRAVNVTLQGSNAPRTSASDAARNAIVADGGTVTTNP
jgi:hypothetical protein